MIDAFVGGHRRITMRAEFEELPPTRVQVKIYTPYGDVETEL